MLQINGVAVRRLGCLAGMIGMLSMGTSWAAVPKEPAHSLDQKAFFRPELYISSTQRRAAEDALDQLPNRAAWEAFLPRRAGRRVARVSAFIDPRSGAATNLMGAFPLIPGDGVGNHVTLDDALARASAAPSTAVDADVVADAVLALRRRAPDVLGIDVAQLGAGARAAGRTPDLWQVQHPAGPERRSRAPRPARRRDQPRQPGDDRHRDLGRRAHRRHARLSAAAGPRRRLRLRRRPAVGRRDRCASRRLEVVPFAPPELPGGRGLRGARSARGYGHRLVWTFVFQRPPDRPSWEVLVDAHTGEVLALRGQEPLRRASRSRAASTR